MKYALLCLTLGFLLTAPADAQDEAPDMQKRLENFFLGTWSFEGESLFGESWLPHGGEMINRKVAGGAWMQKTLVDVWGNGRVTACHEALIRWNPGTRKYDNHHVSNNSLILVSATGEWVSDAECVFDTGEFVWDDGKTYRIVMHYRLLPDGRLAFNMKQKQDGGEFFDRIRGHYTRVSNIAD